VKQVYTMMHGQKNIKLCRPIHTCVYIYLYKKGYNCWRMGWTAGPSKPGGGENFHTVRYRLREPPRLLYKGFQSNAVGGWR